MKKSFQDSKQYEGNTMKINHQDFIGKTIEKLDTNAVNEVVFQFTDGSKVTLETECVLPSVNLYGIAQVKGAQTGG